MGEFLIRVILPWFVNIAYLIALIPQIVLNFKRKTTRGLSRLYIWGYFNGYLATMIYVYYLDFPLAYRFITPIALLLVLIIVLQRFWYKEANLDLRSFSFYLFGGLFVAALIFIFAKDDIFWGNVAGWISISIWSTYQLPQIVHVFREKSVAGFSLLLISLIGLGNLSEIIISIALSLPIQTFLGAVRGIIIYCIFGYQFWIYSKKPVLEVKPKTIKIR